MSKRKKRGSKQSQQSVKDLLRNGRQAFAQGDYADALGAWERAARQLPAAKRPRAAMAEAYFRRGVERRGRGEVEAGYEDLERAVGQQPANRLYRYHLALAAQRLGMFEEAVAIYRELRQQQDEVAARAAYPLALALTQQGEEAAETEVWEALAPAEREALQMGDTFNRRPYQVAEAAGALWQGLAAYDQGEHEAARALLAQARQETPSAEGLARFYLGAMAAAGEAWAEATTHWEAAAAAGFPPERLRHNLGEAYHRLAEARMAADDAAGAEEAARAAYRYKADDNQLNELLSHLYQRKGFAAAGRREWEEAIAEWERAEEHGGGSFRLAYNIALALEKQEAFLDAAERWRETLRRRPRREDDPDALTDEQVARLWQRVAQIYTQIGDYEEAAHVYNTAVKWQPDNVAIRLARAESLHVDGRFEAAENEVDRILKRDPDYVPALLLKGDLYAGYSTWYGERFAVPAWERVLELDPGNEDALQRLVDYYLNEAEEALQWWGLSGANRVIAAYEKALAYRPEDAVVEARLAQTYLLAGESEKAQQYEEAALAHGPQDELVYQNLIIGNLAVGEAERALALGEQAQAQIPDLPFTFNMNIASNCLFNEAWALADHWLERAIAQAPADVPIHLLIAEMCLTIPDAEEMTRAYLEKALAAGEDGGRAHLLAGIVEAREDEMEKARRHWQQVERIAAETGDKVLARQLAETREFFNRPAFFRSAFAQAMFENIEEVMEDEALLDELFFDDDDLFLDEDDDEFF